MPPVVFVENYDVLLFLTLLFYLFTIRGYRMQASAKDPQHILLSVALPPPPPETVFYGGLPFGAVEAVKTAYGAFVQVIEPPESGFHLTIQIDLSKLALAEGENGFLIVQSVFF